MSQPQTAPSEWSRAPTGATLLSSLDRFPATPAGHLAFIETVRDEVHNAAEAKRQQLVLGYSNDTLASMVRGIEWGEARTRLAMLTHLPEAGLWEVDNVLRRELTVQTVVGIDQRLQQVVSGLREAYEEERAGRVSEDSHRETPSDSWAGVPDSLRSPAMGEYADGTNVRQGVRYAQLVSETSDWYRPASSKAPSGWKERWRRLRSRFEQVIDECQSVECLLVEKRVPPYPEPPELPMTILRQSALIASGGGLGRDPSQLFSEDGSPLFGEFPIPDAKGVPIANSAGEPFAFRFGVSRQFFVLEAVPTMGENRPLPERRIGELARDGVGLLYQLPPDIAISLWRNWLSGFSRRGHSNEYLWFDALFELSWQREPGDALHSERHAWLGNMSIQLEGVGVFPRLPDLSAFPGIVSIPEVHRYPVIWRSGLSDVARASVLAIDELLDRADVPAGQHVARERTAPAIQGPESANPIGPGPEDILEELKHLPSAWFEQLVFKYDQGGAVSGKAEAQSVRAIELLKIARARPGGLAALCADIRRLKGEHS